MSIHRSWRVEPAVSTRSFRARRSSARPIHCADFRSDDRGSVAIAFSLATAAAAILVGVGIDYGRGIGAKQKLQTALDAAVLEATALEAISTPAATRDSRAASVFAASLANSGLTGALNTPLSVDVNGSVSASATATLPTTALQLTRVNTVRVSANSQAVMSPQPAAAPSNVTFALTGYSGWYWKQVNLYIHNPGDAADTVLASYTYQPVNLASATGTASAQYFDALSGALGDSTNDVSRAVSMGSTYDRAYLTMTVYSDGCAPGYAPSTSQSGGTTNYQCVVSGTRVQTGTRNGSPVYTTYTKTATPVVYSTNDASTAHNLFVGNSPATLSELPNNKRATIFQLARCSVSPVATYQSWEDTPWGNPLPGSWSQQDIFFTVTTNACALNANLKPPAPRLTN
jgi:Flp pilus assembly protein TadG